MSVDGETRRAQLVVEDPRTLRALAFGFDHHFSATATNSQVFDALPSQAADFFSGFNISTLVRADAPAQCACAAADPGLRAVAVWQVRCR